MFQNKYCLTKEIVPACLIFYPEILEGQFKITKSDIIPCEILINNLTSLTCQTLCLAHILFHNIL